jgi:colanic acid biosynthesis glycosyl transferase WcaI
MKIWIYTMYYLPEFGSAPILMDELASYLADRGYPTEIVTTIPRPPHHRKYRFKIWQKETRGKLTIRRYRTNYTRHYLGRLLAWTIYTLWSGWTLQQVKAGDVLLLRLPPLLLGLISRRARKKKAKVVLSVQDIHPDLSVESGLLRNKKLIRAAQKMEEWIYDQADRIVVISQGFFDNLKRKGVPPEKMTIIPNWVNTEFMKPFPKKNRVAEKLDLMKKFVIMYSGTITLSSYLTLERILEVAVNFQEDPDLLFLIVGEGLKKPDLVKKAEDLKLKNVLFLPFQPYETLPQLLSSSNVLLVPLDQEKSELSVPSKLYNYMAVGRPILGLTETHSEVAQILRRSEGGMTVLPEEQAELRRIIMALRSSPALCREMGNKARLFVEKYYSHRVVLPQYEEILLQN